jgi:hypothetical protein
MPSPSKEAIDAANQIVYEHWGTDSDGDLRYGGSRTLESWPALRDKVAEALDSFRAKENLSWCDKNGWPQH